MACSVFDGRRPRFSHSSLPASIGPFIFGDFAERKTGDLSFSWEGSNNSFRDRYSRRPSSAARHCRSRPAYHLCSTPTAWPVIVRRRASSDDADDRQGPQGLSQLVARFPTTRCIRFVSRASIYSRRPPRERKRVPVVSSRRMLSRPRIPTSSHASKTTSHHFQRFAWATFRVHRSECDVQRRRRAKASRPGPIGADLPTPNAARAAFPYLSPSMARPRSTCDAPASCPASTSSHGHRSNRRRMARHTCVIASPSVRSNRGRVQRDRTRIGARNRDRRLRHRAGPGLLRLRRPTLACTPSRLFTSSTPITFPIAIAPFAATLQFGFGMNPLTRLVRLSAAKIPATSRTSRRRFNPARWDLTHGDELFSSDVRDRSPRYSGRHASRWTYPSFGATRLRTDGSRRCA
jgi:hypothetical protein